MAKSLVDVGVVVLVLCAVLFITGFAASGEYSVVVLADPPEGGVAMGGGNYPEAANVEVEATPNAGYCFVNWTVEGVEVSSSSVYQFSATASCTLVAHFEPIPYTVGVSAKWKSNLHILPTFVVDNSKLDFVYTFGYRSDTWQLNTGLLFKDSGFTGLSLSGRGQIGPARISFGLSFDPSVARYRSAYLSAMAFIDGLGLSGRVQHSSGPTNLQSPRMHYIGTLSADPLTLTVSFQDDSTGICFKDVVARLKGLWHGNATLLFTKYGFEYVEYKARDLFSICCGISFDVSVKLTVDENEVSISPKWKDVGEGCIKVYGDVLGADNTVSGFELYGAKIRYSSDERCLKAKILYPYMEYVIALQPKKLAWAGFKGDESEYIKLGFCGSGCCGAGYSVELTSYFQPSGTLFGLSRVLANAFVPITDNFVLNVALGVNIVSGEPTLDLGWELCMP